MITHELKTPIVPILSYTKMLLAEKFGGLNDIQKKKLEIVLTGSETLLVLIQDILDLHKAELGKLKFNCEPTDIEEVVRESITITQPLADARGVVLQNLVSNDIKMNMDKRRMIQVLTNLIKNAIDFVPKGNGMISIKSGIQNGSMLISVSDNGCGIPKEKIGNLFKKFYQVDTNMNRERNGTGLGLAICKIIVEQHGGEIWAESQVGKGSTMKITLPLVLKTSEDLVTVRV